MTDLNKSTRRQFLKVGGAALVALPIIGMSGTALAAQNASVRTALQYQTTPKDGKQCSTCQNFQAATNGCTLFPGDTEIVPTGYCSAYLLKK
ncbi:high-potential iron-sulfur protein [uncultured Thiodictyon sp.]|uniref:high-potential iron-sulfur protein n=1 Tax=uncultured Thiodictyon sp. TaxID=1846217 RepID=UPI0025D27639|nr:high-potential iron-sulfur protein [uncultured Thiodictyon sp.]